MIRVLKWLGLSLVLFLGLNAAPVAYVELACRGTAAPQSEPTYLLSPDAHRPEARTYLTYPEWHIVYAYEGYGEVLETASPHAFPYVQSVTGFWSSLCALTKRADTLGEAGFNSKATIYTIGVSFTLEMTAKALYEETIGRVILLTSAGSAQDRLEAEMANDYAKFLQQVPWYKYDFDSWSARLRALPTPTLRAYERRLALSLEWGAKARYARLIARAVDGIGADELTMTIALSDAAPSDLTLLDTRDDILIAQVQRYRAFTTFAARIAAQGGTFHEIAGNDDILVTIHHNANDIPDADLLIQTPRPGFKTPRQLLAVRVPQLADMLRTLAERDIPLEHIYDY